MENDSNFFYETEIFDLLKLEPNEFDLWYHGTSYTNTLSILKYIIVRSASAHDFGESPAFYLNSDLAFSVEWARKFYEKYVPVVLVFAVPKNHVYPTDWKHWNLCDEEIECWTDLVSRSRHQISYKKTEYKKIDTVKRCDSADIVEGWISSAPHTSKPNKHINFNNNNNNNNTLYIQRALKSKRAGEVYNNFLAAFMPVGSEDNYEKFSEKLFWQSLITTSSKLHVSSFNPDSNLINSPVTPNVQ